jgi:ComF family protein
MKKAMAAFKYEGCRQDGLFFGDELVRFRGSRIRSYHPDYVIPVPLHRRKLWFRGYNQAACVAERLGERMGIPVLPDALRRVRYTKPQKGMNDKERRDNVEGAFQVRKRFGEQLRGARILLVDDIYTTGATVDACAGALRDEGTGEIFFACLCTGNDE